MKLLVLSLCALGWTTTSYAGTAISAGSMEIDGLEIRDLSCDLTTGGLFASMTIGSSLSKQKSAFDACAPDGAAFRMSWTWNGSTVSGVQATDGANSRQRTCMTQALTKAQPTASGSCRAVILAGEPKVAKAAADEIQAAPK